MGKTTPLSPSLVGGGSQRDETGGELLRELEALSQALYSAGQQTSRPPTSPYIAGSLFPGSRRQEAGPPHLGGRAYQAPSPRLLPGSRRESQSEEAPPSPYFSPYANRGERGSQSEKPVPSPYLLGARRGPPSPFLGGLDGPRNEAQSPVIVSLNGVTSSSKSTSFRRSSGGGNKPPPIDPASPYLDAGAGARVYESQSPQLAGYRRSADGFPPPYAEARRSEAAYLAGQYSNALSSPGLRSRRSEGSSFYIEEPQLSGIEERGNSYEVVQSPRLGLPRAVSEATSKSLGSLNITELTLSSAVAALRPTHKRPPPHSRPFSPLSQSEDLGKRIEGEGGRGLQPWHSQGFERTSFSEVANFPQWVEENAQFSKQLEAPPKEKKSLWNWKPFRAIAHIGQQRFNCMFTVHVHGIEGLPAVINGLRLAVSWTRKDAQTRSMPARVFQGSAEFEEKLSLKSTVYGTKDSSSSKGMKYEPKNFDLAVIALDVDELVLGKHRLDLSRLLPKSSEVKGEGGESERGWTTSFKLAGKAKGGTLIVTFGCQLLNKHSEPTSNLSSARFSMSPSVQSQRSRNSLPTSPKGTTIRGRASDFDDSYSPTMSELPSDVEYMQMEHLSLDEFSPSFSHKRFSPRPSFSEFPGSPKKLSFNHHQLATATSYDGGEDSSNTLYDEDDGSEFTVVHQGHEISAIVDQVEYDDPKAEEDTVEGLPDDDADADLHEDPVVEDSAVVEAQVGEAVSDDVKVLPDDEASNTEPAEPSEAQAQALESDSEDKLPQDSEVLVSEKFTGSEEFEYKSESPAVGEELDNGANEERQEEGVVEVQEVTDWSEGIGEDMEELSDKEAEDTTNTIAVESDDKEDEKRTTIVESDADTECEEKTTPSLQQVETKVEDEDELDLVAGEFLSLLMEDRGSGAASSESGDDSPRALLLQQFEQEALIEAGLGPEYEPLQNPPTEANNQDSPLHLPLVPDNITSPDWGNEEDVELAAVMEAAEAELQKATQILKSKARAKLIEDEEAKALMQEWGLNDKAFDAPRFQQQPDSSLAIVPMAPPGPPLGNGLGSVIHIRDGGSLRSMSPAHFQGGAAGRLLMQVSSPVVVPSEMGAASMDILRRMAVAGMEGMAAQAMMTMPLEDITGLALDQISVEHRAAGFTQSLANRRNGFAALGYGEKTALTLRENSTSTMASYSTKDGSMRNGIVANSNDEYMGLEDLAPMAMVKIEALALEGLKIQAEMADQDAPPYSVEPMAEGSNLRKLGHNSTNMLLNGVTEKIHLQDDAKEDDEDFMSMAVTLDEWMRLDAGVSGEDETEEEQTLAIIAAHNTAHHKRDFGVYGKQKDKQVVSQSSLRGDDTRKHGNGGWGFMGDTVTLAMLVQLRDPLRNNEPVGAPMMALVQAERVMLPPKPKLGRRMPSAGNAEEEKKKQDDEQRPQFKIVDVTVAGLESSDDSSSFSTPETKSWGNQKQLQTGSRWLVANGMGKSAKSSHPALKGKGLPAQTKVQRGESLWSISGRVHGSGSKWRDSAQLNPHVRNPNVIFPKTSIRTR